MLLGENGIIKRAREAGEEYANKAIEENEILSEAEKIMQNYIGGIGGNNNEDNESGGETANIDPETGWNLDKVDIYDDFGYKIPIPKELEYKEGTKDTGVVVIDPNTLNEFVWVPTDEVEYKRDNFTKSNLTKEDCTEPDYNTAYTDSVEKYGGFFIARYEAGSTVARTTSGQTITTPKFQPNQCPYVFVTWQQAKDLSVELYSGSTNIISDLINSYAWDTTLRWIESTNPDKDADEDSTNWGNYKDKIYTITGWYAIGYVASYTNGSYTKPNNTTVVRLGTGVLEDAKANNIYDLAGNVSEWTLEQYSSYRVDRGSSGYNSGSYSPAGFRNYGYPAGTSDGHCFRAQLYVAL